jgi:hypothetical protein
MKNFLQICQDVRREAGLSGSGPTSVLTATGIERKIVGWVIQAWLDMQNYRPDWPWMFQEFEFTTSPGKALYLPSELNLTDVETWDFSGTSIYKTIEGKAGEHFLGSTTFEVWWKCLRIGIPDSREPQAIFYRPADNALMLYPTPDDEYTISLRYYRAAQRLAANGDIPRLPTSDTWEDIIMWRALHYYGYHDGAPDVLSEADVRYDELITALDNKIGQTISIGLRPIA